MIIIIIILNIHHQTQSHINVTLPAFQLATLALHFRISALHFSFPFPNQDIFVQRSGSLLGFSESPPSPKSTIECNRGTYYIMLKLGKYL